MPEETTAAPKVKTATHRKILIVSFLAWTLSNMDQASYFNGLFYCSVNNGVVYWYGS